MAAQLTNGEMLADRVERLMNELADLTRQMNACKHQFGKPVGVTKEVPDPILLRYEGPGSDPEPVYDWTHKKTEYGWTKTCDICGFRQYTVDTKPIVAEFEPEFH